MAVARFLFPILIASALAAKSFAQQDTASGSQQSISAASAHENSASAQQAPVPHLTPGNARKPATGQDQSAAPQIVPLTVPRQTSLQVALETEVRLKKVGQSVSARLVDPVYAFDRLVVPAGSEIRGQVTALEPISGERRTLAGLDADFSPARNVQVTFTDLVLPDGKHLALHTSVTPGSGQVMQFVTAPEKDSKKTVKDAASQKTQQAKQQARDQWNNAMKQLKTHGRIHRLERYAEAQLPVHPQYIPAGTVYFAELEDPLDFGNETLPAEKIASIGGDLPEGSVVHARLLTALSSATAKKGDEVEAVLARPLFDGDRLLYPQGSRLLGSVSQVQPARRMKKNGQLRIAFHQVVLPDGIQQKVEAALVGVQAGQDANLKLDSEGGAEASNPKSRYFNTTVSLGLAAIAGRGDPDAKGPNTAGNPSGRAAGGVGGFKLVGMVAGALIQSRAFGYSMGAFGAGRSIYQNFLTRGHEVVFPKNTAMDVAIGTRAVAEQKTSSLLLSSSVPGGQ
jgi:type IV secretory pathway VirB10-like protein